MAPSSLNPDPTSDQNCHFNTRFQTRPLNPYLFSDLAFRQKSCHGYLDQSINKKIIQIHFEFAYFYFFLFHWNWYDKYVHTLSLFARKPYSSRDKNLYPFSDQKGPKAKPFGVAHTYMAYVRGFSTLPPPRVLSNILFSASFICLLRSPQLGTLLKDHYDQQQTLWIIRFTTFFQCYFWNCDAIVKIRT